MCGEEYLERASLIGHRSAPMFRIDYDGNPAPIMMSRYSVVLVAEVSDVCQ